MSFVRRLAFANFAVRKARAGLTVAAVGLSVSLVVSVTTGYASLEAAAYRFLNQYMGSTDATLSRRNDPVGGVPQALVKKLQKDPAVRHADSRLETTFSIPEKMDDDRLTRVAVVGLDRTEDRRSDKLVMERGAWFDGGSGDVAVVDQSVAEIVSRDVGQTFLLHGVDRKLPLKIVGIVHKPAILAARIHTIYLPLETLQRFASVEGKVSRVFIELKGDESAETFAGRWRPILHGLDPDLALHLASDRHQQLSDDLAGVHLLSYLAGAVSMLAATFIVFSALSMGVTERQRTLAMLRAVGAIRAQIAGLVIFEGLLLSAAGIALGVPLGWLWIRLLSWWFNKIFTAGVVLSVGGVAFAAGGSLLAALAASLLPAWTATRVSPLEAMAPLAAAPSSRPPLRFAAAGLALICIDPLLLLAPTTNMIVTGLGIAHPEQASRWVKLYGHFVLGLPSLMLGFFLLAPLFVWVVERLAGPVIAGMLGVRFALLRQQLSSGIWRAAGTAAALMVGLAVLVAMQVNGRTMLEGWKLPDKFPDVFIITNGLTPQQQQTLAHTRGIAPGGMMPISIASPEYGTGLLGIGLAAIMPNATMFIGVDPDKVFDMMQLEFRDGNPKDAAAMLRQGDHLVVTEELRNLKGVKVGDRIPLKTRDGDHWFTVAGVVWSPGIDVMVSMYDMAGQFDQRTANSVFGSLADGEKYFGIQKIYLFAADLEQGMERARLFKQVEAELGGEGLRVSDVREIKHNIQTGFGRLLLLLSTVAFAAMAVASLGVTNTVMASVRSRRWQFGVLRSIGVTRSGLLRLVLGEAILLGLVGCGLGLAAGLLMSIDGNALSVLITGYNPPLVIPWKIVSIGIGIVVAIAVAASIWPAISVARSEPLALLQAGRAAA